MRAQARTKGVQGERPAAKTFVAPPRSDKSIFALIAAKDFTEWTVPPTKGVVHIKRSINGRIDKGSISHNNREFVAPNVDKSRIKDDITLVREDIKAVYHELFDKPLAEYNAKQKRKDRRIKDYYEHIYRGKQEKPFYELIFQIGNTEDTHCGTPEAVTATKALTEFVNGFKERNPQIRVFNAVIHLDEDTPHVHIDFVPFTDLPSKKGLSVRNSLSKALEQQDFIGQGKNETCTKLWVESEKEQLAQVMRGYGIEWEKLGTHEQHLDVLDYKKKMRTREVALLENKVEVTNHIIAERQRVLDDADTAIDRLDKEFVEKTDAVEALDSEIEDKTAELETTSEQLAVNQLLLQEITEKVSQIADIDNISVKHTVLGGKVTLAADDYEKVSVLAKKQIAAENDSADKDNEISRLSEQVRELQAEQTSWKEERSALRRTIDTLKGKVSELSKNFETLRGKYEKVMEFIEKFDLMEKLDKFLHPIKNIKKHR